MKLILRIFLILLPVLFLTSCGSSKSRRFEKTNRQKIEIEQIATLEKTKSPSVTREKLVYSIISNAREFEGTRYKYGGTDKKGMDCSGLIYVSFLNQGIKLPRTSRDMSLMGQRLYLKEVTIGDLLFFETNKNRKVINHVGLVVKITDEDIYFIHSSTSRGVITSSLSNPYWYENFVMAKRVI